MIRAALLLALLAGCWVDRRTREFACESDADCAGFAPARTCDTAVGYCVTSACPAACASCDLANKLCSRSCGQNARCELTCPTGFACTFACTGNRACERVACGDGACTVTCTGGTPNNPACGSVECNDSCNCNVACMVGTSCDALTCGDPSCEVASGCSSEAAACSSTCPGS